jgi:uncharacterized protein with HEPN domain
MNDSSNIYIGHIIETINVINEISANMTKAEFDKNITVRLALQKLVENIGEAFRHICKDDINAKKTLEDSGINVTGWIGIKNVLNHGYFKIDTEILWGTIENDVANLKNEISQFSSENNSYISYLKVREFHNLEFSNKVLKKISSKENESKAQNKKDDGLKR